MQSETEVDKSVPELVDEFKLKDQHYRVVRNVVQALILILVFGLVVLSYQTQSENQQLLKQLQANAKTRTAQINDLQKHIDCIVSLFTQPDRQTLVISDIENCRLTQN